MHAYSLLRYLIFVSALFGTVLVFLHGWASDMEKFSSRSIWSAKMLQKPLKTDEIIFQHLRADKREARCDSEIELLMRPTTSFDPLFPAFQLVFREGKLKKCHAVQFIRVPGVIFAEKMNFFLTQKYRTTLCNK